MQLSRVLVVLAVACRRDGGAPPAVGSGSGLPPPARDAPPPLVELLHHVPATVTVSSVVQNKAIKPEHLVDGNLDTAWNSRTGELVGAWIDVMVPAGAAIEELRMTAGHTGHGPHGEDYFTMNPRIRSADVLHGDKKLATFTFDIARRDLQTLRVHGERNVRVRITSVEPGSKQTWRETCVSELEVWGTPQPYTKLGASVPKVEVAFGQPASYDTLCAELESKESYNDRIAREIKTCQETLPPGEEDHCGVDEPGPPQCSVEPVELVHAAAPWKRVGLHCASMSSVYDIATCTIAIDTTQGLLLGPSITPENRSESLEVIEASVRDVLPGGAPELVLRYRSYGVPDSEQAVVCRTAPTLECSLPIVGVGAAIGLPVLIFP
jgi:hypothetical protein